jgi:hypothetical protein
VAARIPDANLVNPSVRNQLTIFHGTGSLQQAAKEWYDSLDEATKREVEVMCQSISGAIREHCPTPFGLGSALELLAALIAYQEGWLEIDACKAYRLRKKYDIRWKKHHPGVER